MNAKCKRKKITEKWKEMLYGLWVIFNPVQLIIFIFETIYVKM